MLELAILHENHNFKWEQSQEKGEPISKQNVLLRTLTKFYTSKASLKQTWGKD